MRDEVHSLAAAYAVDAVDDAERLTFEAHLDSCAECREVVAEMSDAVMFLSEGQEVEPPPALRTRVLEMVAAEAASDAGGRTSAAPSAVTSLEAGRERRERRRAGPRSWLLGAAAAAVIAVGTWGVLQGTGPDPIEQIVGAEDAAQHTADTDDGMVAVVTSAGSGQAVLQLPEGMQGPQEGSVYQAWFVHADGTARSAGVLSDEALAERADLLDGSTEGAVAVGLTVEPPGGSAEPTTEPFVVVPLG